MTRKHTVLTAAVCAAAVLGVTGCGGEGDDGRKPGAKSGTKSDAKSGSAVKEKDRRSSGTGETESSSGGRKGPSGVEKLSARDILAKSAEATTSARTMRVSTADSTTSSHDLTMDKAGNCAGTFTNEGFTNRVIRKGDKVWLKLEDSYWNDPVAKPILDKFPDAREKYLYGDVEDSFVLMMASAYCEFGGPDGLSKPPGDGAKLTKGAVTTVEGVKAVPVHIDSAEDGKSTVYVATEGRPYTVKVEGQKPKGAMLLSDFDKPFTVPSTPPVRDTLDAAEIEKLSMNAG
ncbi:hypothetical protein [Streptomyces sp. NPDC088182]|uniref:hypothetical protein n=1 Tax=Streptomyces sp. NPDC088182 TaxID=3365838 RepID=UPI0038297582